jgi:type II secretory pathway predicted ATPase ExeA
MVVATDTKASLLGWADLGLRTNPFPSRGSESNYLKEFSQADIFSVSENLEPMQIFTGISGVGKTVHARLLAKHLIKSQRRPTQLITASRTIKSMGLMKMICCRFNLEMPATDVSDFQKIEQIRRSIVRRKEPVSLIIDDAQNLNNEALAALMRLTLFQQGTKLQVMLIGLPITLDRSKKIAQELQIEQNFSHRLIEPWGAAQTESYIARRFEASGLQTSKRVCRKVCKQIHQLSGGVPMQINRRSNMMLGQLIQGHKKASPEQLKGSLLWGGALLSAVTVGVFCYKATIADPSSETAWTSEVMMLEGAALVSSQDDGLAVELDSMVLQEEFDLYEIEQESVEFSAVASEVETPILELVEEVAADAPESWLSGDGYAVQVMATSAESEAINSAESYETAHVEYVSRKGTPTYVVLVGEFESLDAARSEVSKLSTENEKLQPWVRSFANIRDDIAALNE